ncbi:hypothetical protein EV2_010909 [Malus domestica]
MLIQRTKTVRLLLFMLPRQCHTDTAKYLLDSGASLGTASELGAAALHHAAGLGDIELLRYLISKGADVNSQSDAGSPLIWAAGHGQQDATKILFEHHANPNAENDDSITPLLSSVAVGISYMTSMTQRECETLCLLWSSSSSSSITKASSPSPPFSRLTNSSCYANNLFCCSSNCLYTLLKKSL